MRFEARDSVRIALGRGQPSLDYLDDFAHFLVALGVRGGARIGGEFRPAHRFAKGLPLMLQRHDDEIAVLALEQPDRANRVVLRAGAFGLYRAAAGAEDLYVNLMTMVVGIEDRDIQVLAPARALTMQQGVSNRARGMNSGADIAERYHRERRRTGRLADHISNARICLRDRVQAGLVRQAPALAEGGNRAHHDTRVDRADNFVTETQ